MTVFSTVGYGSHSYDQTEEYIVATIFIVGIITTIAGLMVKQGIAR